MAPDIKNSAAPVGCAPVHVVHVVESFAAGCLAAIATLCHSAQEGLLHSVIHATRPETPKNFAEFFPDSVAFYSLPMRRSISPVQDWRAFMGLRALLAQLRPDVVHCHSSKAGFLGRWAARSLDMPSVYTPHGFAFLRTDVGHWQRSCYKMAEWIAARAGNALVACGREEYELACRLAGKNCKLVCIPNAVNLKEMDALRQGMPVVSPPQALEHIRVGTCGRMEPQRNPRLFAELAIALKDAAAWTWIGAPSKTAALPPHVECSGWLSRSETLTRLAQLDIYVQTSLWDGLSYAVLEAMTFGKPVVATDIPANRAIVEHGVTGFLGASPQEMIAHVRLLVQDAALRRRMGAAARRRVEENHDAARNYQVYGNLYRSLAKKRNKA